MSQYPGIVQFIIDVRTLRPEMASKHARAGTKRFCTLIIGRRTLCGGYNPLISSLATEEKKSERDRDSNWGRFSWGICMYRSGVSFPRAVYGNIDVTSQFTEASDTEVYISGCIMM